MNDVDKYLDEDDDNEAPLGDAILRMILNLPDDFNFDEDEEYDED